MKPTRSFLLASVVSLVALYGCASPTATKSEFADQAAPDPGSTGGGAPAAALPAPSEPSPAPATTDPPAAPAPLPLAISTDKASYAPSDPISVSFSGLSGDATDKIVLVRVGAVKDDALATSVAHEQKAGSLQFSLGGALGRFVARAYLHNGADAAIESAPFVVTAGASVALDNASFAFGQPVSVSFDGLSSSAQDLIAIAPYGASPDVVAASFGSGASAKGWTNFAYLASGKFVARAFRADSHDILAESAPFIVGEPGALPVTLATDKASYSGFESVGVTYGGFPGNAHDWVAVYRNYQASDFYSDAFWAYTSGSASGSASFGSGLAFGSYEIRAFYDDGYALEGRSASFTVTAAVRTDKSSYAPGEPIAVQFAGMRGKATDWVSITPVGNAEADQRVTDGSPMGAVSWADGLPAGSYVARAGWGSAVKAESVSFTVGAP